MQKIKSLVVALLLLMSASLSAQTPQQLFSTYLAGTLSNWGSYLDARKSKTMTKQELLTTLNYEYGYLAWLLDEGKTTEAKSRLEVFNKHIDQFAQTGYRPAAAHVFRAGAAAYGWKLNKAHMGLATEAISEINKAMSIDPNDELTLSLKGSSVLYNPFNPNNKQALAYLQKAVKAFENKGMVNTWNYCATAQCLVDCYAKLGQKDQAIATAKTILSHHPNFVYMRDVMLPKLQNKK